MEKQLLHPDNDLSYSEGISELADYVMNAIMCGDTEEDMDGGESIEIDKLPYDIPKDKKTQKFIIRDLCEEIDMRNRENDRILEDAAIGNGDFYEEEPEFHTPPVNAFFKDKKLHIC